LLEQVVAGCCFVFLMCVVQGLDVFEGEPTVCPDLLALKNVVLLPHIGSATMATRMGMARLASENLIAFSLTGKCLTPVLQ
jgi:glyoxylate/hydroxypyruvate/2-ketogluconate reductase